MQESVSIRVGGKTLNKIIKIHFIYYDNRIPKKRVIYGI